MLRDAPETLHDVPSTWLVGFDGKIWNGADEDMSETDWFSADLNIGDRVGVMIDFDGAMTICVNGKHVVEGPRDIPHGMNLWPVVEFRGNARTVTYIPDAMPYFETLLASEEIS